MVVNDVQHMYPGSVFNTSDLYILPSKKSARSPSDLRRNLLSARQMWTREWIWWSKPAERVVNITYCHDSWVWQGIHEDIVERRLLHGKNEELILVADDTVQGCTSFSCFGPIVSTWHADTSSRFAGNWEQLHHLAPSSRLILLRKSLLSKPERWWKSYFGVLDEETTRSCIKVRRSEVQMISIRTQYSELNAVLARLFEMILFCIAE